MLSMDSLVGLKQQGMFIYSLIHPKVLKNFEAVTMTVVRELLQNATEEYYRHNTIPGCTDVSKRNYNFRVSFNSSL